MFCEIQIVVHKIIAQFSPRMRLVTLSIWFLAAIALTSISERSALAQQIDDTQLKANETLLTNLTSLNVLNHSTAKRGLDTDGIEITVGTSMPVACDRAPNISCTNFTTNVCIADPSAQQLSNQHNVGKKDVVFRSGNNAACRVLETSKIFHIAEVNQDKWASDIAAILRPGVPLDQFKVIPNEIREKRKSSNASNADISNAMDLCANVLVQGTIRSCFEGKSGALLEMYYCSVRSGGGDDNYIHPFSAEYCYVDHDTGLVQSFGRDGPENNYVTIYAPLILVELRRRILQDYNTQVDQQQYAKPHL